MERNLNEILKAKEEQEALKERKDEQMHLDDAARVKIISPARLVDHLSVHSLWLRSVM